MVAVLPFRVHSAQPDRLPGRLARRPAAQPARGGRPGPGHRRRVLASRSGSRRVARATQTRCCAGTARDLGADYVVTGSLTELAGRYSLDVRVTPAAIGLESHTQVYTAGRDEELLGRVNRIADRVVEHRDGRRARDRARGRGGRRRGRRGDAARAARDPRGRALRSAHRARRPRVPARAIRRWCRPKPTPSRDDDGVRVRFDLVLSERPVATPDAVTGERIAQLVVRGNRRIETAAIRGAHLVRVGTGYEPDTPRRRHRGGLRARLLPERARVHRGRRRRAVS